MRIFIPSRGRSKVLTTPKLLDAEHLNYTLVVNTEAERKEYIEQSGVKENMIAVAPVRGLSATRQWCIDQLQEGEWCLFLDDNHSGMSALSGEHYERTSLPTHSLTEDWRELFARTISYEDFLERIVKDTVEKAERIGAHVCGFSLTPNHYFRTKKWLPVSIIKFECSLVQRTRLRLDESTSAMEDYEFTAHNLLAFGRILVNNWAYPVQKHYQAGGLGTYDERTPAKIESCRIVMERYPDLFRYKEKAGCHPRAELQLRFTSTRQVDEWRKKLLEHG